MKIAVMMDPFEGVKKEKDTSYILMKGALERGHEVFYTQQESLSLRGNRPQGLLKRASLDTQGQVQVASAGHMTYLDEMNVVMIRMDPPVDRRYLYTTLLLDFLPPTTSVVNSPQGIRDWNEKLSSLYFHQWSPPTLVSQVEAEILEFVEMHQDVILKPIDGFGGRGIKRAKLGDSGLGKIIAEITQQGSHKIVANKYVKEAEAGDKRIILVNGEPLGAIIRKAARIGEPNNLDQGGTAHPYTLDVQDRKICQVIGQELKARGLFFVGIDLLGHYLTEINVTSPTGLQDMMRFTGQPLHQEVIQKLELQLSH